MNFVSTLMSGFENLYATAVIRNSPCTLLPQHLVSEWQIGIFTCVNIWISPFCFNASVFKAVK